MDCSGGDEVTLESGTARKLEALERQLAAHPSPRTIVFCNKVRAVHCCNASSQA